LRVKVGTGRLKIEGGRLKSKENKSTKIFLFYVLSDKLGVLFLLPDEAIFNHNLFIKKNFSAHIQM